MTDDDAIDVTRGERGPVGDHGQAGDTGQTGATGQTGHVGAPGMDGSRGPIGLTGAAQPVPHSILLSALKTVTVLCGLIVVGISLLLVLGRDDTIRQQGEVILELQEEIGEIQDDRTEARATYDCRLLFEDDVRLGAALSQIALSELFAAATARPADMTDEEKAADNIRLVENLDEANRPLEDAVMALQEYSLIDPPPGVCPHPRAESGVGFVLQR